MELDNNRENNCESSIDGCNCQASSCLDNHEVDNEIDFCDYDAIYCRLVIIRKKLNALRVIKSCLQKLTPYNPGETKSEDVRILTDLD